MQNHKKTMKITLVFPPRSIQCFLLPFSVVPSRLFFSAYEHIYILLYKKSDLL